MALFQASSGGSDEYKSGESISVTGGYTTFAGYTNTQGSKITVTIPLPKKIKNIGDVTFTGSGNFYIFPDETAVPIADLNVTIKSVNEIGLLLQIVKKDGTIFGGAYVKKAVNCVFDFTLSFT